MMSDESTKRERDENHNSSSLAEEDECPEAKKIKLEGAIDEDTVLELTNSILAPPELDSGADHNSFTEPTSLDEREDDKKCIEDIQSKLKNTENDPSVLEDKVYVEEQPDELRNDESAFHSKEGHSFERLEDDLENIQENIHGGSILSQSQDKELNTEPNEPLSLSNPNAIVEERGEISAQYVGKVIGKGGEMLRDLQARSGCRLDVDQNVPHGHPRILTYRGTRKKVDLAKQMVATLCTPQGNETTLPLGSATRKDLAVPATAVGKIIGRSGEMVRELQSRSQAKIQVDHTAKGFKADTRLVSIVGTPEAVVKAEEMISFLVANPLLDAMKAIKMLVEDKMHRGGKWGSGPPYLNMPNQGQNMTPVDSSYNQQQPVAQPYGAPPFHTAGPSTGHGYVVPSQLQFGGYIERIQETEYFPAAKIYMGRIIGQKGVTINDLQKRSGCDIQINQDVPPGSDCIITIKGFRQSIEIAKQMLREIIEMGPDHPYAGGGGQYTGIHNQNDFRQASTHQYIPQPIVTMYGTYQHPGHQPRQPIYGGHQPPYSHQSPLENYGQIHAAYGIPPFQSVTGFPQATTATYNSTLPHQAHISANVSAPVAFAWKSATAADGQIYYYNEKTGETQWDKPAGMP